MFLIVNGKNELLLSLALFLICQGPYVFFILFTKLVYNYTNTNDSSKMLRLKAIRGVANSTCFHTRIYFCELDCLLLGMVNFSISILRCLFWANSISFENLYLLW